MRIILTLLILFNFIFANGGLLKVDWSKVPTTQQKLNNIPKKLKESIKDVTLPVYMPRYYIYEKNLSVVANPNFYAITIFLDKARLMISGDRTYQERISSKTNKAVANQLKAKMKALSNKFIKAEGIISVDFQRNGVNYSLVLECDSPTLDKRCKEDNFLRKVYNGLILIGGKR